MRGKTTPKNTLCLNGRRPERLGNSHRGRKSPLALLLMLFALFAPNIASAEIVTTTYDFKGSIDANNTEVTMGASDADYTNCQYFTKIGNVSDPGRFAAWGSWILTEGHKKGLYSNNGGGRQFLVNNLYANDVVTFDVVDNYDTSQTISLVSTGTATANGNTFTMKEKGKLVVSITRYWSIKSITIKHNDEASYGYDPAIEVYDLYNVTGSYGTSDADFQLNGRTAKYVTNLSAGLALNNRIAISTTSANNTNQWSLDHGLKSSWSWHNISICNLVEGDRVRITYMGNATFSSAGQNGGYNGCAAFKDTENNGEYIENQVTEISNGMTVEAKSTRWDNQCNTNINTSYFYTVLEEGHLDIGLSDGSRICKIEIYADHQAQMVDRYGTTPADGNTSYFDTTGQLETKHHIVPGGLHVYVGNDNANQHAEVVRSDEGPVSFVYDQDHFKMARYPTFGNFTFGSEVPATGTFYKFVPDVNGKMKVKFKAASINYHDYFNHKGNEAYDQNGTPNEVTNTAQCPYYLTEGQNNVKWNTTKGNGATVTSNEIDVTAGQTYYLYGWWNNTSDAFNIETSACGVAELIEVTFVPDKYIYPLAKWVESGATEVEAADIHGYNQNQVCIKKKSDNIESCSAVIENGKLKVKNITYKANTNPGGVVLVKVGDKNNDADPVYALTIAYDASFNPQVVGTDVDGNDIIRTQGYTWNFSDDPLNGLKWNNKNAEADVTPFGTYFNNFATAEKDANGIPTNGTNGNSFLAEEINKGDWTFNYRVKKNGSFMDPRFLNNYDMEGDNADMMWDTQGIIINAGSTQSCIFNEHGVSIDHTNKTQADPDRYVGFLEGGEFIIPKLKKNDRVIVYMGSGNGSGSIAMRFNITNALDAMRHPIDPADSYWVGGSQWNVPNGHNDPYYRGCYHFYAAEDGDMKFKMAGGSMCKLYSIKIYRGEREETNGVQENGGGYTILATKAQNGTVTTGKTSWNLHFRGKGEAVADGTGKNSEVNEIIAHSGNITHYANSDLVRTGDQGVEYTNQGEIGMLRIRVKCMDYNKNYVTDFSERNITLALHETMSYPYTWDFTDINGFSVNDLKAEDDIAETENEFEERGQDLSMWVKDEESGEYAMNLYGPTSGYTNQSIIFENSKGISGNQLYAGDKVIPETKGLWFYFDNNDPAYNGVMKIGEDGLRLANESYENGATCQPGESMRRGWWNYKMVIPNVPADAAVYLRAARDESVKEGDISFRPWSPTSGAYVDVTEPFFYRSYQFNGMGSKAVIGSDANSKLYEANDGSGDYILAIYNSGSERNLTLTLNGWVLKKLAVSEDFKTLDDLGWASESRARVIDPELTSFLTGENIETVFVTDVNCGAPGKGGTLTLANPTATQVLMANTDGETGACLLHNTAGTPVKILNNGFHLFVPDMHDYKGGSENNQKTLTDESVSLLKAQVSAGDIPAVFGSYTNYILSNKRYYQDQATTTDTDAFYRIRGNSVHSNGNNAYLPLLTADVAPSTSGSGFGFFFEGNQPVDGISEVSTDAATTVNAYTIGGQKLQSLPKTSGLYIINGKKVVIK